MKQFACDFETTVDNDTSKQEKTEVWSACFCEIGTEEAVIMHSINQFMNYWLKAQNENVTLFFHNLKFDGSFIIDWLYHHNQYKELTSAVTPL